jgi:hypothetical protein
VCCTCYEGGWQVFGFIKKTTSYGIEKNVFTLHIPPWAPQTYDFVVLTSLTHPRKILLFVLHIGKSKYLSAPLRTLNFSRRRYSNRRNTLACGRRSVYSRAAVPVWLLQAPRVKSMSQYSSCVYLMNIRSKRAPAVHCMSWVHLTRYIPSRQITLLKNMLPHLTITCISKPKCLRTYFVQNDLFVFY